MTTWLRSRPGNWRSFTNSTHPGSENGAWRKPSGVSRKLPAGQLAVLVEEHALEHEDLLAAGMIVRRKARARLVAHDGSHLPGFRRAHEVDPLAPHAAARARRPCHPGRVGHGPQRKLGVQATSLLRRTPLRASRGSPATPRSRAGSPRRP